MASNFDRWEKDPFFSAAEEVQESADRMESTYRTWVHAMKNSSGVWNSDELRRDLQTSLGTTKWQLEEFERAVSSSYTSGSSDDAKDRHREFIIALESQISRVESSLNESAISQGKPPLPWVRLDEGERNELALFLSGPPMSSTENTNKDPLRDRQEINFHNADKQSSTEGSKDSPHSLEWGQLEAKKEFPGHRRTASASADIGAWKIAVVEDVPVESSSGVRQEPTPRKIPSFSGFLNTMEFATKFKLPKSGYRKLKVSDHQHGETILPRSLQFSKDLNACYERSKSCLDGCDESYDKQLYGWSGTIQRQLRRFQYHVQYSRPVQVVFSSLLLVFLIVLLVMHGF